MLKLQINSTKKGDILSSTMTDISFLLIIFFLITSVFISDTGIVLKLPDKNADPTVLKRDEVIVAELGTDYILIDDHNLGDVSLYDHISRLNRVKKRVLILNVVGDIKYKKVLGFIDEAKKAGIDTFSVKTVNERIIPVKVEDK